MHYAEFARSLIIVLGGGGGAVFAAVHLIKWAGVPLKGRATQAVVAVLSIVATFVTVGVSDPTAFWTALFATVAAAIGADQLTSKKVGS